MSRLPFCCLLLVLVACGTTPRDRLGSSLGAIRATWGPPDVQLPATVRPPGEVPQPQRLSPGDTYLFVEYASLYGRQWHLTFVTATDYRRLTGAEPGTGEWFLLEVDDYDEHLRF